MDHGKYNMSPMVPNDLKGSKMLHMVWNGRNAGSQMFPRGPNWFQMVPDVCKCSRKALNVPNDLK